MKRLPIAEITDTSDRMINNVMNSTWKKTLHGFSFESSKQSILLHFIQTSTVEMYGQWIADGKKIPLEEMIKISNQLLCAGVNGFVECCTPI